MSDRTNRDECAFELRAVLEDAQAETPEQRMERKNPRAWQQACDMMQRIDAGALIDGYNAASCEDGCGRVIEWKDFDIDGPDLWQPQGFKCCVCDLWTANECGDRETRTCNGCKAEAVA